MGEGVERDGERVGSGVLGGCNRLAWKRVCVSIFHFLSPHLEDGGQKISRANLCPE